MLRRLCGDDVAENGAHLSEYFIKTPAYRMALSGEKRFIIGRKGGAGKSAICQQLQKQLPQSGALCIPVAPQRIQFAAATKREPQRKAKKCQGFFKAF